MNDKINKFNGKVCEHVLNLEIMFERILEDLEYTIEDIIDQSAESEENLTDLIIKESEALSTKLKNIIKEYKKFTDLVANKKYKELSNLDLNKIIEDSIVIFNEVEEMYDRYKFDKEELGDPYFFFEIAIENIEYYFISLHNAFEYQLKKEYKIVCKTKHLEKFLEDSYGLKFNRVNKLINSSSDLIELKGKIFDEIYDDLGNYKVINYINNFSKKIFKINGVL